MILAPFEGKAVNAERAESFPLAKSDRIVSLLSKTSFRPYLQTERTALRLEWKENSIAHQLEKTDSTYGMS